MTNKEMIDKIEEKKRKSLEKLLDIKLTLQNDVNNLHKEHFEFIETMKNRIMDEYYDSYKKTFNL